MGTYLSTPVTEKNEEAGESLECPSTPVAWGVVDMQGWRKSMEDAHIAQTDLKVPLHHFEETISEEVDGKVFGVFDGHGGPEVARFCQLYLIDVLTNTPTWKEEHRAEGSEAHPNNTGIGQALITAFHGVDKLIGDPKYLEELMELRYNKPDPKERRVAKRDDTEEPSSETTKEGPMNEDEERDDYLPSTVVEATPPSIEPKESTGETTDSEDQSSNEALTDENSSSVDSKAEIEKEPMVEAEEVTEMTDGNDNSDDTKDDDSTEVVGKEEASATDQNMDDNESSGDEESSELASASNGKVGALFQKFLNMSGQDANSNRVLSTSQPSVMENGRLACNLPDHPIHAGATAIVAVIVGRTLTVANAGDSRGVLCQKGGTTHALSFDHKPQDERENNRIQKAGGFVNQFGRVNGNLNLSRSIGDLKYKQGPSIHPSEQIITAEPDITQITLDPEDEFIVLGCDGIWDCLTNEQAVEYVRSRIDKKYPTQIGVEMLDEIISHDPRVTQGIGGDNMTVMIIDLQPQSRPYRNGVEPEPTAESPKKLQPQSMQLDDDEEFGEEYDA